MINLNKQLSYSKEKKKEEEEKEKEEEKKADVELQKYYKKLYKHPDSEKKGISIDSDLLRYYINPHTGKKSIILINKRKYDDNNEII